MPPSKYKISYVKVDPPRLLLFLEGLQTHLKLGHQTGMNGKPMTILAIGFHNRTTIGQIHPAALALTSDEVTSVAYIEE